MVAQVIANIELEPEEIILAIIKEYNYSSVLEVTMDEIGTAFDYCIIDGDVLRNVYYNPDSNSGGQIVVDEYDIKTQIIPYLEDINGNYKDFSWGEISSEAYECLYDFGNDEAMSLIYPWVMKDYEKSTSLENTLARIETEYYPKRVNNENPSREKQMLNEDMER